jgi:hypothetical protein
MISKFFIYGLTAPDGEIRYIGLTKQGLERIRQHGRLAFLRRRVPVACWIRSLRTRGLDFGFVALEYFDSSEPLPAAEQKWIAEYKARGARLLNCTAGGEGLLNPTPEIRAKMSEDRRGLRRPPRSSEWCKKLSEAHQGRRPSEACLRRHAEVLTGRPLTEVHKAALRAAKERQRVEGRLTLTVEQRLKIRDAAFRQWQRQSKPVIDETTGQTYPTKRAAAAALGVTDVAVGRGIRAGRPVKGHLLRMQKMFQENDDE